ncbi:class I SAM-dependent methyltransferase [Ruminiclostridium cellobioparum]|uniref:class I SAM-dependent methyltransferase n=1 Tax=Ruminiclostridium cellobioparum TaxID=29355 RepID=UPI000485CA22|nr:class I SAM-dependent methyltransferase [Ruminiclostridium cellobioparum]
MNTEKFSGKANIYEKYRPEYPKAFIDYLYDSAGFNRTSTIADVGAGTGILTRQLLEKGSRVYGVEPNNDMRRMAETKLAGFNNFYSVDGTAENTRLDDRSIDFVTVAQAFHWFDALAFQKECMRILKPGGLAVLVWNSRAAGSELVMENAEICKKYCPDFTGFSGGMEEKPSDLSIFFKDGSYETKQFDNKISYDLEGFIGRNLSASYAPNEKETNYVKFVNAITSLFDRYSVSGKVAVPNVTRCYSGKVQ